MREKKYALKDLKVGMIVSNKELSRIYDKLIILVDTHHSESDWNEVFGTIAYIGNEVPEHIKEIREKAKGIMPIRNSSIDLMDEVCYDE